MATLAIYGLEIKCRFCEMNLIESGFIIFEYMAMEQHEYENPINTATKDSYIVNLN